MKTVPKNHSRSGIKIKCSKCDRQVDGMCPLIRKSRKKCLYHDKQKYQLIKYLPKSGERVMRTLEVETFEEAYVQMIALKKEIVNNGGHKQHVLSRFSTNNFWDLSVEFLLAVSAQHPLAMLNKKQSDGNIRNTTLGLKRFVESLKVKGYNIKLLKINEITLIEADHYYNYLKSITKSDRTFEGNFIVMRTFFNWLKKVKHLDIHNPFAAATLTFSPRTEDATYVRPEDFKLILEAVTPKNGITEKGKTKAMHSRNVYRPYLKTAFRLALETGCRRAELLHLKWSEIVKISAEHEIIRTNNIKVNLIKFGNVEGKYKRIIAMTKSLRELLNEMGYDGKKGSDEYIIDIGEGISRKSAYNHISRAFNHYSKLVNSEKSIIYDDLRKTYISRLTMALGSNVKMFTGHTNDKIIQDHYLAKAFIAGNLDNLDLMNPQIEPK